MSYIYYGTTDLIALPRRDVQTFPSGLVRVDRVYACRKNFADRYRRDLAVGNPLPLDPGTPAIDGLYIFPEPRETVRDDGFVEFVVSGYGRTATIGSEKVEDEYTTETLAIGSVTTQFITRSKILTQEFVLAGSESVAPTTDKIPERPEVVFEFGGTIVSNGNVVIGGTGAAALASRQYRVALRSYTARNFGSFSEVTVTYAPFVLIEF